MISDAISTLFKCILELSRSRRDLAVAVIAAVAVALGCWALCWISARLWNTSFRMHVGHHVACAMAGVVGFFAVLAFFGLVHTESIARLVVDEWRDSLESDSAFESSFAEVIYAASDAVVPQVDDYGNRQTVSDARASGSFGTKFNPSEMSDQQIADLTRSLSEASSHSIWAHFSDTSPFLAFWLGDAKTQALERATNEISTCISGALHAGRTGPDALHDWQLRQESRRPRKAIYGPGIFWSYSDDFNYPCAEAIKEALHSRLPRVVILSRSVLLIIVIVTQLIAFGYVGMTAYRDLKVHQRT
jgi:hypothetical protein